MSLMPLPKLKEEALDAINTLGQWLAQNELTTPEQARDAGLIVLAGNAVLPTLEAAAELAVKQQLPLLITGGIGHSTTFLYATVARHSRYNRVRTTGLSEADLLATLARDFCNVPDDRLLIERASTNCGENARFTRKLMAERNLTPGCVVLVQDPTMQRRTVATFAREWRDAAITPQWISYPGIVPQLVNGPRGVAFANAREGLWPIDRYISLVLGEMVRLYDDEQGYGPRGKDFIVHVDMPPDVLAAWDVVKNDAELMALLHYRAPL